MDQTLFDKTQRLKSEISLMRRGQRFGRSKPHKPVMLLSVLDLIQSGELPANRIPFDQALRDRFEAIFSVVRKEGDWCQPSEPYFHLRTSGFWFHKPQKGRERACAELDTSGGGSKRIADNIEYAFLDPDSYEVVRDDAGRKEVFCAILSLFFSQEECDRIRVLTHFSL